jgi:hypothetical protein
MLDRLNADILLSVNRVGPPSEDQARELQTAPQTDELFRKISADGPSLCKQWMPHDSFCDIIEQQRQKALLRPLPSQIPHR